eukprot:353077-Chlamydomonas_euryale.AAC.21
MKRAGTAIIPSMRAWDAGTWHVSHPPCRAPHLRRVQTLRWAQVAARMNVLLDDSSYGDTTKKISDLKDEYRLHVLTEETARASQNAGVGGLVCWQAGNRAMIGKQEGKSGVGRELVRRPAGSSEANRGEQEGKRTGRELVRRPTGKGGANRGEKVENWWGGGKREEGTDGRGGRGRAQGELSGHGRVLGPSCSNYRQFHTWSVQNMPTPGYGDHFCHCRCLIRRRHRRRRAGIRHLLD